MRDQQDMPPNDVDELPDPEEATPSVHLYSQTRLFYWWPVWLIGFAISLITYGEGNKVTKGDLNAFVHPDPGLGLTWVASFFVVLFFTTFSFRGARSIAVIAAIVIISLALSLMNLWDNIYDAFAGLSIHMNLGFYMFVSTTLFIMWVYATFIHPRFNYYRVRPGQITARHMIGEGETAFDARGAVMEKHREDLFRHIILGLGAGDLKISTSGAKQEQLVIRDVLFIDRKADQVRKLLSVQPDDFLHEPEGD